MRHNLIKFYIHTFGCFTKIGEQKLSDEELTLFYEFFNDKKETLFPLTLDDLSAIKDICMKHDIIDFLIRAYVYADITRSLVDHKIYIGVNSKDNPDFPVD